MEPVLRQLGGKHGDLAAELAAHIQAYVDARAAIEQQLVAAARRLRGSQRQPFRPWRGPRLAVATGILVAAMTVVTALAAVAILEGALRRPIGTEEGATGAVFGATGSSPGPPAGSAAAPAVVAFQNFDLLRIGTLEGAGNEITQVTGAPSVASFPSPFDRSVQLTGAGSHGFCLSNNELALSTPVVTVDIYTEGSVADAELRVAVVPASGSPRVAGISLRELSGLPQERWYRVESTWGGSGAAVDVRQRGTTELLVQGATAPTSFPGPTAPGVCVAVSGMDLGAEVLIDNLQIER